MEAGVVGKATGKEGGAEGGFAAEGGDKIILPLCRSQRKRGGRWVDFVNQCGTLDTGISWYYPGGRCSAFLIIKSLKRPIRDTGSKSRYLE